LKIKVQRRPVCLLAIIKIIADRRRFFGVSLEEPFLSYVFVVIQAIDFFQLFVSEFG
jgi:hypothetical protein